MKPTDILRDEHRSIERSLDVLEICVSRAKSGEPIPAQLFRDALHFTRVFTDGCQHRKEETILFPAMEQKGVPREGGPIGVMLEEHDAGRAHVRAIENAMHRYEAHEADALGDLTNHISRFVLLLREHINKEDNVLFVMADQHLSESDQGRLSREFQDTEGSSEACVLKPEMLALLERLERQVAHSRKP